jgi:hypothetical protein
MDLKAALEETRKDFEDLSNSDLMKFEEVKQLKKITGIYFIYFQDKIIYIGSTNKFDVRFGTDLFHKSTHTLHRKLLRENKTTKEIRDFLRNKCYYRVKICKDKLKAEALEHFAIWMIKPRYNHHIYQASTKPKP